MDKPCELLEKCTFYNQFSGNQSVRQQCWGPVFCWDVDKSAHCHRKMVRQHTGQPPPSNLTPLGKTLSESEYVDVSE